MTTTNLTPTAKKLYEILLSTGGAHENKLTELLFDMPKYIDGQPNHEYWQWDANVYGIERTVKNEGEKWNTYTQNIKVTYDKQLSDAYQELRRAGLATEKNNGYNSYWFFPKKLAA